MTISSGIGTGSTTATVWSLKQERPKAVCHVHASDGRGYGSGFLIGKNLMMTNNHVLPTEKACEFVQAHFMFGDGEPFSVDLDASEKTGFFYTSESAQVVVASLQS